MSGLDTLNLSSVASRVRNPQGNRRWGNWDQSPPKAVAAPARVTQELLVANQNYAVNNLAPKQFYGDVTTQLVQRLAGQDFWVRPAARWFSVNVTAAAQGVLITAPIGSPFIVVDPIVTSYQIAAKIGEDIVLDYGTEKYELKIIAVTSNTVTAVPKAGGATPPPMNNVYAYHRLDAYFLELTTTFVVPDGEVTLAGLLVRSRIRLVYYTDTGSVINQEYQSIPIRSLAGTPFYATTPVTGNRFGVATATGYTQVAELFNIIVARVPDEVNLLLAEVNPTPGRVSNPALYIGDYVNVSIPVNNNLLSAAPANIVDQQQYPPVDHEDFLSSTGDIVMVSAGQQCPPGYENVAQVESEFNEHYVKNEGLANPNNGKAALIAFTLVVASGVSTLTANLPHPTPADHSLAGPQNDSSTYELLVVRNGKRFAYRIPGISFTAAGVIQFTIPADLSFLLSSVAPNLIQGYLFEGGLLLRDALGSADVGKYTKPFIDGANIELLQWSFTGDGPIPTQGLTVVGQDGSAFLDRLLVPSAEIYRVGDIISFRDANGNALSTPAPTEFLSDAAARNIPALAANYPFGPSFKVAAVNVDEGYITVVNMDGTAADVSGYVIALNPSSGSPYDTSPPSFKDNFFRITTGSVEHTHLIEPSDDQQVKYYNDDGHWTTRSTHYHTLVPEAVIPPYVKMIVCARL